MEKHYNYIYIVCVNGENTRYTRTLPCHIRFIQEYKHLQAIPIPWTTQIRPRQSVLFVVSLRGDHGSAYQEIDELMRSSGLSYIVDRQPNWGGTIASLWDTWKLLENKVDADYIMTSEDDWLSNHWPLRETLLEAGYIYVGMQLTTGDHSHLLFQKKGFRYCPLNSRSFPGQIWIEKKYKPDQLAWTDGGFYFFKFSSMKLIEDKIGCFTKAPQNEHYQWDRDGVGNGELGFPWELYSVGFKFVALGPQASRGVELFDSNHEFLTF